MKKNKFSGLIGAAWVLALASSSTMAQTQSLGPNTTSTPIPLTTPVDWNKSLEFSQFNPALGTLISVELNLSTTLSTTLTITNASATISSSTAFTELQITVQDVGGNLSVSNQPQLDVLSPNFAYNLAGDSSITSGPLTNTGVFSKTFTQSSLLSEFAGSGSVTLNASTFTLAYTSDATGATSASQSTEASLTGNVIYNYDPTSTPEPSAFALLLVGLSVLGLRARTLKRP